MDFEQNTMSWAFYLKAYDVALAATEGVQKARAHALGKTEMRSQHPNFPDDPPERQKFLKTLERRISDTFDYLPRYAIEIYDVAHTAHTNGLEYMTCAHHGIGGRPNAVMLLMDDTLSLLQIRQRGAIGEIDMLQAAGLNLILKCNRKRVSSAFGKKNPLEVNRSVYFLTKEDLISHHSITSGEEEKFKLYNTRLRRAVALK